MLINGNFKDLKNDDTYFKGTAICALTNNLCALAIFGLTFAATFFVVNPFYKFDLYLKELELSTVTSVISPAFFKGCSSLLYCHKDPEDCS